VAACLPACRILEVLLTAQPHGGQNQEQHRKVEKRAARMILAVRGLATAGTCAMAAHMCKHAT
jgi:hypothetical protein